MTTSTAPTHPPGKKRKRPVRAGELAQAENHHDCADDCGKMPQERRGIKKNYSQQDFFPEDARKARLMTAMQDFMRTKGRARKGG